MMTIAATQSTMPDGSVVLAPTQSIPANAIAVICDGTKYTVYEPGDTAPPLSLS